MLPERCLCVDIDISRWHFQSDESHGETARRKLVLVHDVPPSCALDLRGALVVQAIRSFAV
jgi:hypothetical protein